MDKERRNKAVFLLTIDALRSDHLKSYGYIRNTAPNINKFAQKGTVFLNAITNGPETPTAFSSIFTSSLPFLDGGYSPLPLQKITLPQLLSESGVYTYSIHSNPNLGRYFNYDRGFDVFLDGERYKNEEVNHKNFTIKHLFSTYIRKIFDYKDLFKKLMYRLKGFNKIKSWIRTNIPSMTEILLPFTPIAYNAPYIVNKLSTLIGNIKKPFFVWAHFMDVHSPYNPPKKNVIEFRNQDFSISEREFLTSKVYSHSHKFIISEKMVDDLKSLYDGEIHFLDQYLAKLLNLIYKKFNNDCLVIIVADHGESFYEHGIFGHQGSVYEEVLKIPLIIAEIGKNNSLNHVQDTVQLIDIAPTILQYFNLDIPRNFQGKSLLATIKGESIDREDLVISECYQKNYSMKRNQREGYILLSIRKNNEWKYIYNEEKEEEFIFNLINDPNEKTNLYGKNKLLLQEFREIKEKHIQKRNESTKEKSKIINAILKLDLKKLEKTE